MAELLELADEPAAEAIGVGVALEIVGSRLEVLGLTLEEVPDHDQDGVAEGGYSALKLATRTSVLASDRVVQALG